jgi:lipid-A-disaccharide synthase
LIGADEVPTGIVAGGQTSLAKRRSIMVCAGDISADQHVAKVITALKRSEPDLDVWGIGGPDLEKTGAELLYRSENVAILGLFAIINRLPQIAHMRSHLVAEVERRRPDLVLLVDFGGFNLRVAGDMRKRGMKTPIVYFISPQVWGSRPGRIKIIEQCVNKALVIFPFEEGLYRQHGIDVTFVGHPITDKYAGVDMTAEREAFCNKHQLALDKPLVGIFPGSRSTEIRNLMPVVLQSISWLRKERPEIQFAMSQANPRIAELIHDELIKANAMPLLGSALKLVNSEDNVGLMSASDIVWAKSGTTTLEAAMLSKPMLVYYRADWVSFFIVLLLKRVKYFSLPNLLAGKMLVPELIQLDCRAEQLVRYTRDWLDVPAARADISRQLGTIKSYLRQGDFAANAAAELEKVLSASKT